MAFVMFAPAEIAAQQSCESSESSGVGPFLFFCARDGMAGGARSDDDPIWRL
jgi:hypothetical protein